MPATTSTSREQRWLRTRLNTVGLPVFRGQAPEGQTLANGTIVFENTNVPIFPCIIFRRQGGVDIMNLQGTYMVRSIWLVFVASKGSFQAESQTIVNAMETYTDSMHAAIHKPLATVVSGRLIAECFRETEYDDPEILNGVEYQRIGGFYRITSNLA